MKFIINVITLSLLVSGYLMASVSVELPLIERNTNITDEQFRVSLTKDAVNHYQALDIIDENALVEFEIVLAEASNKLGMK